MAHLEIHCFEYLKSKQYRWTFINDAGGSFSNSGMHRSIRKAAEHYLANRASDRDPLTVVVHIEGHDENDNEIIRTDKPCILSELL